MKADVYKLLKESWARDLSHVVCGHLEDGYELYGTPFVNSEGTLFQAVILVEDEDEV